MTYLTRQNPFIAYLLPIVIALVGLSGCANMQSLDAAAGRSSTTSHQNSSTFTPSSDVHQKLMSVFAKYKGVPYLYGGTDHHGFDCSGFINTAFDDAFQIDLPRTTQSIAASGTRISRSQLIAGDIVFFKTSAKDMHAGIYTRDGHFIHSSTSKGVIESSLQNNYWNTRFIAARRVL